MNRRQFCKNSILGVSALAISGSAIASSKGEFQRINDGVRLLRGNKNMEITCIDLGEVINGFNYDVIDCEVVSGNGTKNIKLNPTKEDFTIEFPDGSIWRSDCIRKRITNF